MQKFTKTIFIVVLSIGILFSSSTFAQNLFWVGGSGNWNDPNKWSATSGGASAGVIPTLNDNVFFDSNSPDPVSPEAYNITITENAVCADMTWQEVAGTIPTLSSNQPGLTIEIYGSLSLQASVDNKFEGTFVFKASSPKTILSSSRFHNKSTLKFDNPNGIWTLISALNVNNILIQEGELNASTQTIQIKGNWTMTNSVNAKFNSGQSKVRFIENSPLISQTITTNTNSNSNEFNEVFINNKAGVILNSPVTIGKGFTGGINFSSGIVTTTQTNILIINNRAEANGANPNSYVNGYVKKIGSDGDDEFEFPIGNASVYRKAGLKFKSFNDVSQSSYTARYIKRSPNDSNYSPELTTSPLTVSSFEYWEIEKTGIANPNIILSWQIPTSGTEGYLGDVSNANQLVVASWKETGQTGIWESDKGDEHFVEDASPSKYAGTLESIKPMANRRIFTIGSEIIPLPIELLYFRANLVNNQVSFDWATAKEINNDYFTIEKSADGIHFEALLEVDGAGNSLELTKYTAAAPTPFSQVTYYRLKQTDIDGTYSYSKIASVHPGGSQADLQVLLLHNKEARIKYHLPLDQNGTLTVYNSKGVLLWRKEVTGNLSISKQEINLPINGSGLFIISMQTTNDVIVKKLIIL